MSRRSAAKQDSLDLLLDTICNTFGGVLFIAILVVLLLQQTGKKVAIVDSPSIPAEQIHALNIQLSELNAELTQLRANQDAQNQIIEQFGNEEIQALLKQRQALIDQLNELQSKLDGILSKNADTAVRVASMEAESEQLEREFETATSEKETIEEDIKKNRESRTQEVRMPLVKSAADKAEIGFILQYDRLYLWHEYDSSNNRVGLNTNDFVVVGDEDGVLITKPSPTGGIKLDGSASSQDAIRKMIRRFRPSEHVLVAIVRPDSFAHFQRFRDISLELGFNYRLMPVSLDTKVVDHGGRSSGVQ